MDVSDWPVSRTANLAGSNLVCGKVNFRQCYYEYSWTEGSRADGSVIFDGLGNYDVLIRVHV